MPVGLGYHSTISDRLRNMVSIVPNRVGIEMVTGTITNIKTDGARMN